MNRIYYILCILVMFAGLTSCKDDILYDSSVIYDGETQVDATIFFERFAPANLGQSRSDGDAIKEVNDICVLLYKEGKLSHSFYATVDEGGSLSGTDIAGTVDQDGNSDRPSDGETSAEKKTPSAKLKFTLPSGGKYKMFAVANTGDIATQLGEGSELSALLDYNLTWVDNGPENNNSMARNKNNQMLGYFSTDGSAKSFQEAPELVFGVTPVKNLYCWLRRAASKVTVSFDAANLEANVRIYLKSVQIRDIPVNCPLGSVNTSASAEEIKDGEIIYYCNEPDKDQPTNLDGEDWPVITRGQVYGLLAPNAEKKESYSNADYHNELSPALYFYENMQGIHPDNDKRQDATGPEGKPDGVLDYPGLPDDETYRKKDGIAYGTYIEVVAYYNRLGDKGKIIYRFMLGKDVLTDYNAERNFHYKLTLKFNGYANDVDWHIEYEREKNIIIPDPYYISYLYNEEVKLPIKIIGDDFSDCELVAEITENNWSPIHTIVENGEIKEIEVPKHPAADAIYYPTVINPGIWYGFLSLAKNMQPEGETDINKDGDGIKIIGKAKHYNTNNYDAQHNWFKTVWEGYGGKLNKRTITDLSLGSHDDAIQGTYNIEKNSSGLTVHLPYYTRQKQIMPTSSYTGNNPYVAYRRKAKVKVSLYKKVNETKKLESEQEVTIYQVRRCVNPKGIWRAYDNDREFHVKMMILEKETDDVFKPYKSDGPWRAYVEIGSEWIMLDGVLGGRVEGARDTYIDFKYKPVNKLTNKSDVRCGIIVVEYNNYTCKHKIFVRQGYAPLEMNEGKDENGKPVKIKWHTFNLYSKNEETQSPLEEGTLFKFRNLDEGILASNNDTYGFQVAPGAFDLSNGNSATWDAIKAHTKDGGMTNGKTITYSFTPLTMNVEGEDGERQCFVASASDYNILMNEPKRQYGYGVLYGDGAKETATNINEVYGYMRKDGLSSTKGMRGCFVYNTETGNQLFFPIGATGNGKRKTDAEWYAYGSARGAGKLQYAWRSALYPENVNPSWSTVGKDVVQLTQRPLFYDVYRRPGAIYWCNSIGRNEANDLITTTNYLDVNYFTFEFSLGNNEAFQSKGAGDTDVVDNGDSSACLIRLVERE